MGSRLDANSNAVRKRIEQHTFEDEDGEEYGASAFGGFTDYFRRKKLKLQNLDAERRRLNADKPQIFRGVVVHVNGYTQPSLNDLHAMIVDHGGGFLQYLDGKTSATHIVASSLTPKKAVEFRNYRIVKPAWVVDSVEAGKLLPWSNYRVLEEGARQNVLAFQNGAMTSQANAQERGYRYQTDTSWYAAQVKDYARQADEAIQKSLSAPAQSEPSPNSKGKEKQVRTEPENVNKPVQDFELPQSSLTSSFGLSVLDETDLLEAEDGESEQGRADEDNACAQPAPDDPSAVSTSPIKQESDAHPVPGIVRTTESPQKSPSTAEEHNARLLADPKTWRSTVVNPDFLKHYYEQSRLHHLSTWKAELKSKLQAREQEQSMSQRGRYKRPAGARRYILHVDFDCFFAAVSLKKRPEYQDKPTVVAHGSGTASEIASCNYHARKFGVKNGMWMKGALELCPNLKVLPYDFEAYEEASRQFYAAILEIRGIVQSVSIDEALVDVSLACIEAAGTDGKVSDAASISKEQGEADNIALSLRKKIRNDTGCEVSVGIGSNILLAKLALRKAKPAGQHQVITEDMLEFIGELSVGDLPSVAWSLTKKLEELGVKLVKDLRELTKERLMNTLGPKTGQRLWEYARGIDRVEVGDQVIRKSVSAEVNWGVRFVTHEQVDEFLASLCEELHNRLLNEGVKGQQLTMKVMKRAADAGMDPPKHLGHGKCDVFNKSTVLGVATNDPAVLSREAVSTLKGFGFSPGELRGIGIQMTKLEPINRGPLPGGQRRLQFRATEKGVQAEDIDKLDIIETPKKPKTSVRHEAAVLANAADGSISKPLNIFGSQFVLPSQVDPTVLAELPADIRSKLMSQPKAINKDPRQNTLEFTSRPAPTSQTSTPAAAEVTSASQIDPETLAALPEDVRAEVLLYYKQQEQPQSTHVSPSHARQVLLPQSPHSSQTVKQPPKRATPTKRGRGRPRGSRAVAQDARSGLLQSNIVPASDTGPEGEELSEEFLAALPEELREEVLAQHRASLLRARGGLSMPEHTAARGEEEEDPLPYFIDIKHRNPAPTFTAKNLSKLPELRDVVTEWVTAMEGDGPSERDVEALGDYLRRVVLEEKDMAKAVQVAKWLDWVVCSQEWDEDQQQGRKEWLLAVESVKKAVADSVAKRRLPPPEF